MFDFWWCRQQGTLPRSPGIRRDPNAPSALPPDRCFTGVLRLFYGLMIFTVVFLRLFFGDRGSRRNMVPTVSLLSCGAVQSASGSAPTP